MFVFSLFEYCVICNLRYYYFTMRGCVTTLRFYYEEVVLLQHYVSTTKGLFLHDITSLLRRGCFTTTSRHHYEGVVLLQHPLYVSTTNDLFAYTCFTTVTCTLHIYFNYYFCANFFYYYCHLAIVQSSESLSALTRV